MLKIRDDIDLKELEKYGFVKRNIWYELYDEIVTIEVDIENRTVYLYSTGAKEVQSMNIPYIIYDLIKDGLVEKVEE